MAENKKINKQGDEITRHAFISNMEAYINRLLKDPIHAQPNEYLKSHGLTGEKTLKHLLDDKILTRKESIKTDKETKKDKFCVQYKMPNQQDIEKKLRNLYIKLFEYHITDNQLLNEDGEGGCACGGSCGCGGDCGCGDGATNASCSGQFSQPLFGVVRRGIHTSSKKKKKKENKETDKIDEGMVKTIFITESQAKHLEKAYKSKDFKDFVKKCHKDEKLDEEAVMDTAFGDFGYDAPVFGDKETRDHKNMMAKSWNGGKKKKKHKKHLNEEDEMIELDEMDLKRALRNGLIGAGLVGGLSSGFNSPADIRNKEDEDYDKVICVDKEDDYHDDEDTYDMGDTFRGDSEYDEYLNNLDM